MSKRDSRSPAEIVASIEKRAVGVKDAATLLSDRILAFENYVATVPGRIETRISVPDPVDPFDDEEPIHLVLRVARKGKSWNLEYAWDGADQLCEFRAVRDSSLHVKLAAIRLLPQLLAEMEVSQRQLEREIREATDEFDRFFAALPSQPQGGK